MTNPGMPADIAAAIEEFELVTRNAGDWGLSLLSEREAARASLDAAILARLSRLATAAERLEKDIADTEAARDHFREKLAEMYDHHAAALARAERLEKALAMIYGAAMTLRPIPHVIVNTVRTALDTPAAALSPAAEEAKP